MFDQLSQSLNSVFRTLRGYGRLTEQNVQDALREVRLALLEADVQFEVARDFVARVKEHALGEVTLNSITPGQQLIGRIHEELVRLLGRARADFDFSAWPTPILLLGLHGAGKTTTAAKLARRWSADGKRVLLVACDLKRPAAVEQLATLARQIGVDCAEPQPGDTPATAGARAMQQARAQGHDIVLFDSAGRFQVDEELVQELKDLRAEVRPTNTVLVLDAAIGQESVRVAQGFHQAVGLTGLILTKLDGDARGGAALSVHAVTGVPILWIGMGEKTDALEPFHPDRMASRILGMGDIVSLVEKAQAAISPEDAQSMAEGLVGRRGAMDFETLLTQMRQLKKLGPMEKLLELMPGMQDIPARVREQLRSSSGGDTRKSEAIILSMTPRERRQPGVLNGSRRARIARGAGVNVSDVNELVRRFDQMRKMMKKARGNPRKLLRLGR
ncbi:MAG: signal recognition particle protein [Kiritimatiellae bacterium]|nr:signal recognition particle protein [Kiritimatiellia bacterium]